MLDPRSDLTLAEIVTDWRKRRKRWRLDLASPPPRKARAQRAKRDGGSSKFRGVYLFKPTGKWIASLRHAGQVHHCGSFALEVDAAHAYDRKAREVIGPAALTNFETPNRPGDGWS